MGNDLRQREEAWDHTSHEAFYSYYAGESQNEATFERFRRTQRAVLRVAADHGLSGPFAVADIGCGAGTQARLWAEQGHRVFGLDVNEPLIKLAQQRARENGLQIQFDVGTASALPWQDDSMDVCLLPELLEHVADWRSCLLEAIRVLRPGGVLYLSTTNWLCPAQQEFNLPAYSWYPPPLKRYCEHLARTTRPSLANFAKYPAVNWFTYYSLRKALTPLGFRCLDRFDLIDDAGKSALQRLLIYCLRKVGPVRFLGHITTPGTYLVAVKQCVV